jgi:hypothetical protein
MSSCPPHIASCSGGVSVFLSDAGEDLSTWLVTSVVIDFQLSLPVEVGSALAGLFPLASSEPSDLLVYTLINLDYKEGMMAYFGSPGFVSSALSSSGVSSHWGVSSIVCSNGDNPGESGRIVSA